MVWFVISGYGSLALSAAIACFFYGFLYLAGIFFLIFSQYLIRMSKTFPIFATRNPIKRLTYDAKPYRYAPR